MAAAKKVKAPAALILALGKGPAKAGSKPMAEDESDEEEMGDDVPPDFEEEAIAAFPELDGSPERIAALHRAIKCCS